MDDVRALVSKQNRDLERIRQQGHRRGASDASSVLTEINETLGHQTDDDLSLSRWEQDKQRWNEQLESLEHKLAAAAAGAPGVAAPGRRGVVVGGDEKRQQEEQRLLEAELSRIVGASREDEVRSLKERNAALSSARLRDSSEYALRQRALEKGLAEERQRRVELEREVRELRLALERSQSELRRLRIVVSEMDSSRSHMRDLGTSVTTDHRNQQQQQEQQQQQQQRPAQSFIADMRTEDRPTRGVHGPTSTSSELLDRWQSDVARWRERIDATGSITSAVGRPHATPLQDHFVRSMPLAEAESSASSSSSLSPGSSSEEEESVRLRPVVVKAMRTTTTKTKTKKKKKKRKPLESAVRTADQEQRLRRRRTVHGVLPFESRKHMVARTRRKDTKKRRRRKSVPPTGRLSTSDDEEEEEWCEDEDEKEEDDDDGVRSGLNKSNIDVHVQLLMDEERIKDALAQHIKTALLERVDWLSLPAERDASVPSTGRRQLQLQRQQRRRQSRSRPQSSLHVRRQQQALFKKSMSKSKPAKGLSKHRRPPPSGVWR